MVSFVLWHMTTSTPVTENFFSPLLQTKHHPPTPLTCQNIYAAFLSVILLHLLPGWYV
jgi:hypothetical protein